jgi:hypothetical protein
MVWENAKTWRFTVSSFLMVSKSHHFLTSYHTWCR